jgi:transposase
LQPRIVSLAADGLRNTESGELLAISRGTAALWHARFAEHQRDGLLDEPRPGRPRTIGDAKVEGLMVRALETTPKDAARRSTRSMVRVVCLTRR